jgi:hypothetical protein
MIKRAILNLGAGVFRVSKPGVDVSSALDWELLLKEDYFYGQISETGYINLATTGTYNITFVNDLGFIPLVIIWPVLGGTIIRPTANFSRGTSGGNIFYSFTQADNTHMSFINPSSSDLDGAYYQVCKVAKG